MGDKSEKERERKKIMNAILNDHYSESEALDANNCKTETKTEQEQSHFYFKSFKGMSCQLFSGKRTRMENLVTVAYLQTEVVYIYEPNISHKKDLNNISQTGLFFIPKSNLDSHPEMKGWMDLQVSYSSLSEKLFLAKFPTFTHRIFWAHDVYDVMGHIKNEETFILTKSHFQIIKGRFCNYDESIDNKFITNRIKDNTDNLKMEIKEEPDYVHKVVKNFFSSTLDQLSSLQDDTLHFETAEKYMPGQPLACDLCGFTGCNNHFFKEHLKQHMRSAGKEEEYQFYFESFQGVPCLLNSGSRQDKEKSIIIRKKYYQLKVVHRINPNILHTKYLENFFSKTFHFFLPESILESHPELKHQTNVEASCKALNESVFRISFPSFEHSIFWATGNFNAMELAQNKDMFIITKTGFQNIQNNASNFCEYVDLKSDGKISRSILQKEEESRKSQRRSEFELLKFKCPIEGCKFMSEKQFAGLRLHMASLHFSYQIEQGAKPRNQGDAWREKVSSCMSNWNCSIPQLKASGDLVHHYGIYHCLVDQCFQEYGQSWIEKNFGSRYLSQNRCPYDGIQFEDESNLVNHLTFEHFYQLILPELKNITTAYKQRKGYVKQKSLVKCPFCTQKFDDMDTLDKKVLVAHCGADHGFTLYHMMVDKSLLENKVNFEKKDTLENNEDRSILEDKNKTNFKTVMLDGTNASNLQQADVKSEIMLSIKEEIEDHIENREYKTEAILCSEQ